MKAIVIEDGSLRLDAHVPIPSPQPSEILVRIHATAVNFVDLMRKPSHFGGTSGQAAIAGLEFCGIVEATGSAASAFRTGDRVMAMGAGSYAEYACVDQMLAAPLPDHMDWTQSAGLMVSFMTAYDALRTQGRMKKGDAVLVLGCTSSAGLASVQLARWLGAAAVIGTSTSQDKLDQMPAFGLTHAVRMPDQSLADAVRSATGEHGVDVIIDMVGASLATDSLLAAALGARWISVGRLGGSKAEIDLNELARKRVSLIGVTFRTRSIAERQRIVEEFRTNVLPGLSDGRLISKVDRVFDLAAADEAQSYVRSRKHFGKVVLSVIS